MDFAATSTPLPGRRPDAAAKALPLTAALLCALCFFAPAARAAAQEEGAEPAWETSLAVEIAHPFGYVQVGENQYPGNRLSFHGDLGVDVSEAVDLGLRYHITPRDTVHVVFQMLFLDGSATLPHDVFFNGTQLEAGTALDTTTNFPDFFRLTAMYERYLLPFGDRGTVTGGIGFTFVGLNFRLHGTVAPGSPGNETKEDFNTQEPPVPLLGLGLHYPLTDRLGFFGGLDGGYLPWVNSGRSEGGTVDLTQSHLDAVAGLRYALLSSLGIEAGPQFSYFVQHERSHEDDNYIQLSTLGVILAMRYSF